MRPLRLLLGVGRAVLKYGANLVGGGLGDLIDKVWRDWDPAADEAGCVGELQALVQMSADDLQEQIAAVVSAVAEDESEDIQRVVSSCLQQVPELVRESFRRSADPQGRSVPPSFRLRQPSDLTALLSSGPEGSSVSLQFSAGPLAGQTRTFTEPTVLLFGRDKDCDPVCPREDYPAISRHHIVVEINPPDVCIRDLGSRNGTFRNGHLIGKRPDGTNPEPEYASPEHPLAHGDEVRLTKKGLVAFRVEVHVPAFCASCEAIIPEEQMAACARPTGGYLCSACRNKEQGAVTVKVCIGCNKEVADEPGANRPGQFVCAACRGNAQRLMNALAAEAQAGQAEVNALNGYVLGDELGHGGMGAVYLARHQRSGQDVVVKLMLPRVAADKRAVARFQKEIHNTMALRHRHVVRCLDHGFARGSFFLVLEYCDGGSVDKLMAQRGGTLPVDEAVEITLQALEGLEYAHNAEIPFARQGKGLVHRDLKPANLFLTGWGSNRLVKVGDYGLAKAFEETGLSGGTRTGEVAGTWAFMCRRQVVDFKRAKAEVDVWSLAASLYNMLTGQVPRDFTTGCDPWLVVLESDAVPIRQRNAKVPQRLAEVIDEALREEATIPFQSATAFRQALDAAL